MFDDGLIVFMCTRLLPKKVSWQLLMLRIMDRAAANALPRKDVVGVGLFISFIIRLAMALCPCQRYKENL